MAQQAIRAYESGDHVRAAQLYLNAWRADPKTPSYLYSAARAEQASDQPDRAEAHYREFMGKPGADAALIAKANGFLKDLRQARLNAKAGDADQAAHSANPETTAAPPVLVAAPQPAPEGAAPLHLAAWTSLGSGAALGIASAVVYLLAANQRSELDKALATRDASGLIVGTTHAAAVAQTSSIDAKRTASLVLGSVGVAAIAAGVWLWLREPPESVAIVPGPGDVGIGIAFRR